MADVPSLHVVSLAEEHIAAMQAIEKRSFPTAWPSDSFERELNDNKAARYLVGLEDGVVVGYVGAWVIMDEVHITTMAVDPDLRSLRRGRRLLAALLHDAVEDGARWCVLEVRESNAAAIRMYEAFGFRQVGVRKKYYENEENALVLWVGAMQNKSFRDMLEGMLETVTRA